MIQLDNIDKYYDSRFQRTFVLKAVNLEVKEGEFVSIMGPSGSGKSTLLALLRVNTGCTTSQCLA